MRRRSSQQPFFSTVFAFSIYIKHIEQEMYTLPIHHLVCMKSMVLCLPLSFSSSLSYYVCVCDAF